MNREVERRIILTFLLIAVAITFTGCGTATRYNYASESRYWDCEYEEIYYIQTEPNGCRVYVQDELEGESPIKGTITGMKFRMNQSGKYKQAYDWGRWSGRSSNFRHAGETSWGPLTLKGEEKHYTVKAFKTGYRSAEQRVKLNIEDDVFKRAIVGTSVSKDGRMVTKFIGKRNLLLVLQPLPEGTGSNAKEQQQQQQQQQTVVFPGEKSEASDRGSILVSSLPEYCDVYLDGIFVGNTPTKLSLKAGIHIIEVKKDGYGSFKRELRILDNSDLSIRATLNEN